MVARPIERQPIVIMNEQTWLMFCTCDKSVIYSHTQPSRLPCIDSTTAPVPTAVAIAPPVTFNVPAAVVTTHPIVALCTVANRGNCLQQYFPYPTVFLIHITLQLT